MNSDLPKDKLIEKADAILAEMPGVDIHFKYTCDNCGNRCMFEQPNTLFTTGECERCKHIQPITKGGFTLVMRFKEHEKA